MSDKIEIKSNVDQRYLILGALGLIFITLKLCGVIDWSWWWVLAPFWAGFAVVLLIIAIPVFIAFVCLACVALSKIIGKIRGN